jgi:hypothetical protein
VVRAACGDRRAVRAVGRRSRDSFKYGSAAGLHAHLAELHEGALAADAHEAVSDGEYLGGGPVQISGATSMALTFRLEPLGGLLCDPSQDGVTGHSI